MACHLRGQGPGKEASSNWVLDSDGEIRKEFRVWERKMDLRHGI